MKTWSLRTGDLRFDRPLLMGVVNVTPDSFSDGGLHAGPDAAIAHGLRLLEDGADILDVGGESTRPGASTVDVETEIGRVERVVSALAERDAIVSIDTMKPEVAAAALAAGAEIINDVGGLRNPAMTALVAEHGAGVVIMHMRGEPRTMQNDPSYDDVVAEVASYLDRQAAMAEAAGVAPTAIVVDPGIGFGKTVEHNLALVDAGASIGRGRPLLVGLSRKRFLGVLTGIDDPSGRDEATDVANTVAISRGADVLRVHDVARPRRSLTTSWAIVGRAVTLSPPYRRSDLVPRGRNE